MLMKAVVKSRHFASLVQLHISQHLAVLQWVQLS